MRYLFLLLLTFNTLARPVGYSGSYTLMSENYGKMSDNTAHYSPSYKYSLGLKYHNNEEFEYQGAYAGWLAKRFNKKESQGNIFFFGGAGTTGGGGGTIGTTSEQRK